MRYSLRKIGHLAVAAHLREAILTGQYRPGTRLPSEADLASAMGCGRDTIRDAFAVLRCELLSAGAAPIARVRE